MYSWSCGIRRAANRNGRKRYCKWLFLRGGADPTLDAPSSLRSARWGLLILERAPVAVRGGLFCWISDIGNDGGGCVFDGRKLFNIDKFMWEYFLSCFIEFFKLIASMLKDFSILRKLKSHSWSRNIFVVIVAILLPTSLFSLIVVINLKTLSLHLRLPSYSISVLPPASLQHHFFIYFSTSEAELHNQHHSQLFEAYEDTTNLFRKFGYDN